MASDTTQLSTTPSSGLKGQTSTRTSVGIETFLTDGSFPALCAALSRPGAAVRLHASDGGCIQPATGAQPWTIDKPDAGHTRLALLATRLVRDRLTQGVDEDPANPTPPATIVPLALDGMFSGFLTITGDDPDPGLIDAVSKLARSVQEFCTHTLILERRQHQVELLHEMSSLFVTTRGLDATLEIALKAATTFLDGHDDAGYANRTVGGMIHLLEQESPRTVLHASRGLSGEFLERFDALPPPRGDDSVAVKGGTLAVPDLSAHGSPQLQSACAAEGLMSMCSMGLTWRKKFVGVLRLFWRTPRTLTGEEVAMLRAIADQIAAAVASANLRAAERKGRAMQRAIDLAAQVQRRMLPNESPRHPRLDVATRYESCLELGGDFCDLIELPGEQNRPRLAFVIGDVVGKGTPAALLMASVRSLLRAHIEASPIGTPISGIIERVNRTMLADTLPNEFATIFVGVIDETGTKLTYVNAGHDHPLLIRAADGSIQPLDAGGPLVGVVHSAHYDTGTATLNPGDTIIAYTDGIPDAMDFDNHKFGKQRLTDAIRLTLEDDPKVGAKTLADQIVWHMRRFIGLKKQTDDVTLTVVRALP